MSVSNAGSQRPASNPLTSHTARLVIGHRGNRAHAPENTLESLRQAVALGADAVEFDVHLSSDGVAVLMHDPTLTRTTDSRARVDELTARDLARVDAGARFTTDGGRTFPWKGRGLHVPTLEEALDMIGETPVIVEIKAPAAQHEVLRLLRQFDAASRALVDSMHASALTVFRGTEIAHGAAMRGVARTLGATVLGRAFRPDFQALCVPPTYALLPLPLLRFARLMQAHSTAMHVWTVNDERSAEAFWRAGINGIITDDPARMLALRNRMR